MLWGVGDGGTTTTTGVGRRRIRGPDVPNRDPRCLRGRSSHATYALVDEEGETSLVLSCRTRGANVFGVKVFSSTRSFFFLVVAFSSARFFGVRSGRRVRVREDLHSRSSSRSRLHSSSSRFVASMARCDGVLGCFSIYLDLIDAAMEKKTSPDDVTNSKTRNVSTEISGERTFTGAKDGSERRRTRCDFTFWPFSWRPGRDPSSSFESWSPFLR